jgi:glycosyltransferase involved in cell wall biosynthesis
MNVLHLIDTTGPGGAETVFVELAARSRQAGHPTAVIRGPGWVKDQLELKGIAPVIEDCKGSLNWRFLAQLRQLVAKSRIDLIHAHLLGSNVYASLAGALTGRPVISTFHGAVDISPNERFAGIKFGAIKRFSTVVAVSEELQTLLSDKLHVPKEQIHLIPNAIDCQRFATATPLPLRDRFGKPQDVPLIGALGNIRPAKDYPNALRALAALHGRGQDAALLVAGHQKEPLMSALLALRAELGLEERVYFLGFLDTPEQFIASLDIFLLSSSSEGHPLALTQAMAAGVPIVATRCGVEKIISENTAWLADKESPEGLAASLGAALVRKDEAQRRAREAQTEAFAKYDFEAMFGRYRDLYLSLFKN